MLELNKVILEDLQNVCARKINWDKFRNASVLVTGANGLIATYIIYMLLYLNEYQDMGIQVIGLARNPQKVAQKYGSLLERDDFRMIPGRDKAAAGRRGSGLYHPYGQPHRP